MQSILEAIKSAVVSLLDRLFRLVRFRVSRRTITYTTPNGRVRFTDFQMKFGMREPPNAD